MIVRQVQRLLLVCVVMRGCVDTFSVSNASWVGATGGAATAPAGVHCACCSSAFAMLLGVSHHSVALTTNPVSQPHLSEVRRARICLAAAICLRSCVLFQPTCCEARCIHQCVRACVRACVDCTSRRRGICTQFALVAGVGGLLTAGCLTWCCQQVSPRRRLFAGQTGRALPGLQPFSLPDCQEGTDQGKQRAS